MHCEKTAPQPGCIWTKLFLMWKVILASMAWVKSGWKVETAFFL
jgi:hypothetical protein